MRFGSPGGAPSVKLAASAARKVCLPSSMRRAWEWRRRINAPAWAARALPRILCPSASLLLSAGGCSFVVGFCYLCIDLLSLIAQTASPMKLKPSLFPAIVFLAVLAIQLLPGCTPSPERSRLEHIESIIDEHPDSAMALINSVDTAALRSDRDRALYGMLRNLAIFKNFSDSLNPDEPNQASEIFIDLKDYPRASRTLYLLGNFQMANSQFGNAAVALTKGLEFPSQDKGSFSKGLCAFSLYELYGKFYDTNNQIVYARLAADNFRAANKLDWELYSQIYLAGAYINKERYDSSMYILQEVLSHPYCVKDSSMNALASELYALSAYKSNQPDLAVEYYAKAFRLDTNLVTTSIYNIRMLLEFYDTSKANSQDINLLKELSETSSSEKPFQILAKIGNYKEAYEEIEKYRTRQDDFIKNIMSRTIDSSVSEFRKQQNELLDTRLKSIQRNRIYSGIILLLIAIAAYTWAKNRLTKHKHEYEKQKLENEKLVERAQLLSENLNLQIKKYDNLSDEIKELFKDKCSTIDRLCTAYYQTNSNRTVEEVKKIIHGLTDSPSNLKEIEKNIDLHSQNLISLFREELPELNDYEYVLFTYSALQFSTNSIALLTNEKKEVLYNRKSRLKAKIKSSDAPHKDRFLSILT